MTQLNRLSEKSAYKIQAWIAGRYKPLIIRGNLLHSQVSRSSFGERRGAHETSLDLWLDGSLYPYDPISGQRPKFKSTAELLEYVAEGDNGLLGYVKRLENSSGEASTLVREKQIEIGILQNRCQEVTRLWGHESSQLQCQLLESESALNCLQSRFTSSQTEFEGRLCMLHREKEVLQSELHCAQQKLQQIEQQHSEELSELNSRLSSSKTDMLRMQRKLHRFVKTPSGYRQQVRARRDLSELAPTGGHAKATRRLARSQYTGSPLRQDNAP